MNKTGKGLQSLIPPKKSKTGPPENIPIPQPAASSASRRARHNASALGGEKNILYVEIEKITQNPHQPRKNFDKTKLQELADSIKEHGILQPLIVTLASPIGGRAGNKYQLIAGERRHGAAKIAGLSKVPVIIRDSSEQEKLELALVENLQRDNLNPIEKAYAFKKLIDNFNLIQQDIGKRIGKSREVVANTLRLLELPAEIQRAILNKKITEGHGRVILTLPNVEKQLLLFKEILKKKLSVRQADAKAKKIIKTLPAKIKPKSKKDPYLKDLEDKLENVLNTRVKLTRKGKKGKITIEFFSQEEMDGIIDKILKK